MPGFQPQRLIFIQVSFLIPPEIVPGRMTLLVTLFLVLINIFNNITSNSPNVEGLTSISAWVITCILFVFGALSGYAGILFKKNRLAKVVVSRFVECLDLRNQFFRSRSTLRTTGCPRSGTGTEISWPMWTPISCWLFLSCS